MTKDEALKQAREVLCKSCEFAHLSRMIDAITAIDEAIAEQDQTSTDLAITTELMRTAPEPVAYLCENAVGQQYFRWKKPADLYKPRALYLLPPRQPWVELTAAEDLTLLDRYGDSWTDTTPLEYARAIMAKLKELNT